MTEIDFSNNEKANYQFFRNETILSSIFMRIFITAKINLFLFVWFLHEFESIHY